MTEYPLTRHYTLDTAADRTRLLCDDAIEAARWTRLRLRAKEDPMDSPEMPAVGYDAQTRRTIRFAKPYTVRAGQTYRIHLAAPHIRRVRPRWERIATIAGWLLVVAGVAYFAVRAAIS